MALQKQNNIFENKFPCMVNFALCDDDDGLSCSLRYIPYAYILLDMFQTRYAYSKKWCGSFPYHHHKSLYAPKCHRCVLFCRMFNKHEESVFSYIIFERDENNVCYTKTCFYLLMNKLTF